MDYNDEHFFRYELRNISAIMAEGQGNGDNARYAFRRYDFLVWC